ncbi:methionine synthase reductase [Eupeodes corollae]|uniref:methionine synthase reductase n=1 Tax=Eupeodes corollae TaxID=290404 RepID=UPI002492323C|nr:methionine synthase reductase [Eupeodes corollae]
MIPQSSEEITKLIENNTDLLKNYTPASLPVEYIDVQYEENTFQDDSQHMQIKCTDLQYPFSATPVISAPIHDANILYDGPIGSKKFIELTLDYENNIDYQFSPGDTVGILVSNSARDVDVVLMRILSCVSPDVVCDITIKPETTKKSPKFPPHVPKRASPRALLRDCLDLKSIPKKLFLRSLAEYTTETIEKNFLMLLSSKEGAKHYNHIILEQTRTFLDILELCSSCCPPLSILIEHLPRLKPRPYSIANSPLSEPGKVRLIFSTLTENPGVATSFLTHRVNSFLKNPNKTEQISFYFRESNQFNFRHQEDSILIGIGCGVSPFLGFLAHKDELMKHNTTELGSTWLFVGSTCQDSAVHRDELLDYQLRGVLQHLYESFSRDPDPECGDFKYVQDQLRGNIPEFVELLTRGKANLYVCADGTKISKSIEQCIKECLAIGLECTGEEAEVVIKEMRLAGRYKKDIWV